MKLQKNGVRYPPASTDYPVRPKSEYPGVLPQTPAYYLAIEPSSDKEPVHENGVTRKGASACYPDKTAVARPIFRQNKHSIRRYLQKHRDRCCSYLSWGLPGEQKVLPGGR